MEIPPNHKLLLFLCTAIPLSFVLWTCNIIANIFFGVEEIDIIRWLVSCIIPCLFAVWGLKKKSLSNSGAFSGVGVGFIITLSNYAFLACLIAFFVSSSKATKYKSHLKQKLEKDFEKGSRRNWIQVLSNGLVASGIALLFILDCGCGEQVIDIKKNYRCSWLSIALIGAFSSCNGDTWSSELGPVMKFGQPYLLTSFEAVPKGTNGGVSIAGLIASLFGGFIVGLSFVIALYITVPFKIISAAPSQWPVVIIGGIAGLVGSLIDSFLGATMQYSGQDKDGKITEIPGSHVKHISGRPILDNHMVNFLSSVVTALIMPYIVIFAT